LTPHHLLFFTQSKTLTLIFLLSHHYHVAAATLHDSHHNVRPPLQLTPFSLRHHLCHLLQLKTNLFSSSSRLHLLQSSRCRNLHCHTTRARETCIFCACNSSEQSSTFGSTCTNVATIFSHETVMLDAVHHTKPPHPHLYFASSTPFIKLPPSSRSRRNHHYCTKTARETCSSQRKCCCNSPLPVVPSSLHHAWCNVLSENYLLK